VKKLSLLLLTAALGTSLAHAKITLPRSEEFKLDNGLVVKVVERHQLPLFSLQITFRAGSVYDPAGKEGLASLTSDMLMRGTASRTARQIAEEVAFGGGTLSNSCDYVAAGLEGEFLTAQGEKAFEIASDLLRNSAFTAEEFDKTKPARWAAFRAAVKNPGNVANDAIGRRSWPRAATPTFRAAPPERWARSTGKTWWSLPDHVTRPTTPCWWCAAM